MKHTASRIVLFITLLALPGMASAGIDPDTGFFYISYQDLLLAKDGHELKIQRNYNSSSVRVGWFGYGWGSKFETRLVVLPDGSAAVTENGNGYTMYYTKPGSRTLKAGVDRIVEAAVRQDRLTPAAAEKLAVQLMGDENLRLQKVIAYGVRSELPKDASLDGHCGKAALTRVPEGYRRQDCNPFGDSVSATDTFDLQGRMIRHELEDGYTVKVRYRDSGAAEIRDSLGQAITLSMNPDGTASTVTSSGHELTYDYDGTQNLVKMVDPKDNSYRYDYDGSHNLTRVTYLDDSSMFVSYSPRENGRANAVTTRTGEQSDRQGRVLRRREGAGFVEYRYHPVLDRIIEARTPQRNVKYGYNAEGALTHAEDGTGRQFDLAYDEGGHIRQVIEKLRAEVRRELLVERDDSDRLARLTISGVGSIRILKESGGYLAAAAEQDGDADQSAKQSSGQEADGQRQIVESQVDDIMEQLNVLLRLSNNELNL